MIGSTLISIGEVTQHEGNADTHLLIALPFSEKKYSE